MTEYRLKSGYVLSDEEIERRASEWEDGTWEGRLVETRAGRPRLSEEPNANLSFKCPATDADMIARAAEALGEGKSAFMRDAAVERAASVLAAAMG